MYTKAMLCAMIVCSLTLNFWCNMENLQSWKRGTKTLSESPLPHELTERWIVLMTINDGFYEFFANWWANYKLISPLMPVYVVTEVNLLLLIHPRLFAQT
jgi:hypothetical protein